MDRSRSAKLYLFRLVEFLEGEAEVSTYFGCSIFSASVALEGPSKVVFMGGIQFPCVLVAIRPPTAALRFLGLLSGGSGVRIELP